MLGCQDLGGLVKYPKLIKVFVGCLPLTDQVIDAVILY